METSPIKVGALFSQRTRLVIPPYQREYQWGPDQWQALWRDVGLLYKRSAEGAAGPDHFMGIVLFDPIPPKSISEPTQYQVIDGQQRLTSLLVLLAAIRDADLDQNDKLLPEHHGLYSLKDEGGNDDGPRLQAQHTDQKSLSEAMNGGWRTWYRTCRKAKSFMHRRTLFGYTYFRYCIWQGLASFDSESVALPAYRAAQIADGKSAEEVWAANATPQSPAIDLNKLNEVVRHNLMLVEMRLNPEADEDAPTIFESINAKRTELEQWDFIRNLIFTRFEKDQALKIFDSHWRDLQDELLRTNYEGKRSDSRDAFVYDYVIARGEHQLQNNSIARNRGFEHLRKRMNRILPATADPGYEQALEEFVVDDFLSAAKCWPVAVGAARSPFGADSRPLPLPTVQLVESISRLSAGPPFPAVLHYVEGWHRKHVDDATLRNALGLIESFLARSVLAKRPLSPLRAAFMTLMDQVAGGYDIEQLQAALVGTNEDPGPMPNDEELLEKLLNEPYYKSKDEKSGLKGIQLGAVFRALERQLAGPAANPLPYGNGDDHMTVEHVFPQSCVSEPHGTWAPDLEAWGASGADIGLRLHRLGNLTLITFRANRYLRDKPFAEKKSVFRNEDPKCPHPVLSINTSIYQQKKWTAAEIDQRTKDLASLVLRSWPFPEQKEQK